MLNFEQFTALVKAGCNEEQIKVINNLFSGEPAPAPANPNPNPTPNPNPPAPVNPEPAPRPADVNPNPNPNPNPKPTAPANAATNNAPAESETVKMLKEMLGLMQKGAINNIQIKQPETQTAEQILASVLEP